MTWMRVIALRIREMFAKRRLDAELDEELRSHLEMLAEENMQRGMAAEEARRTAKIALGGVEQIKEAVRDQRGMPLLESLVANVRFGLRILRKNPGFAAVVVLTLALGIGANTAIFTVAYATLLAPLPYPQPSQLVNIRSELQGHPNFVSPGDFTEWKRQSTTFEDLNACGTNNFNIATQDRPEFFNGMEATPGYYGMLGNPLFLGRNFLAEEGEPGKEHVVILTHRLWRHLGANPKIIGQTMQINGEPYTVVGVMAPGTADRWDWELIVPLVFKPEQLSDHDFRGWLVTGRLKPGVTIQQAQAEMDAITAQEAKDYPKSNQGWGALVEPYEERFFSAQRKAANTLAAARRRGISAADRVLERSQSAACQGHYAAKGSGDSRRFGSAAGGDLRAVSNGEPCAFDFGRRPRRRGGICDAARAGCGDAPRILTRRGRSAAKCSHPADHACRHNACWRALWLRTRVVRVTFGSGGSPQGGRAFRNRRQPPSASPGPGDCRVCLGSAAAYRSRVGDSQLLESHARRSRRPHRSHSWVLHRSCVAGTS